jgi:hypothetical protein
MKLLHDVLMFPYLPVVLSGWFHGVSGPKNDM